MCYINVHCSNCGADYHLYSGGKLSQKCPHCYARMPSKAFLNLRFTLFCVEEINKDFRTAHEERSVPLFQIEIRNHYVPNELVVVED